MAGLCGRYAPGDDARWNTALSPSASRFWSPKTRGKERQKFKVKLPPGMKIKPIRATTEAKPQPAPADDPRSSFDKNTGGYAN